MSRVRELREKEGLTQKELGLLVGCNPITILKMEAVGSNSLNLIEKVAKTLGVHPSYLCGWSDDVDGTVKVVEKVIEKEVEVPMVVYKDMERIPNYWKADENEQLVRWKERKGKSV